MNCVCSAVRDDVSKITHTTLGRAMPCLETRPVDFTYLSAFGVIVIARVQCNLADPWRPWPLACETMYSVCYNFGG